MEQLIISQSETLEQVKIIAAVAGLSKTDVKVKSDSKENVLFITTTIPKELDADIKSKFEFEKEASINVDTKYAVTKSKVTVENGVLLIVVPVSDDRIKSIEIG